MPFALVAACRQSSAVTTRRAFIRGLLAGVLVMVAIDSLQWLLSPEHHPLAAEPRRFLVIARGSLAVLGAIWMTRGVVAPPPE